MATVKAPAGNEPHVRAIVFREGETYIAQCIDYDICVQATEIPALLDRLELTVEAEFESCRLEGKQPRECISPAPNYYHELWEKRSISLTRVNVPAPDDSALLDIALAA